MKREFVTYSTLLVCFAMLVVPGCARRSAPTTFFLLSPIAEPLSVEQKDDQVSVAVGPFSVAAYLDREQIVTLRSRNEMAIDDFKQWAEPLADNMKRVLIENLSIILQTAKVYDIDQQKIPSIDFQLAVRIDRFDVTTSGSAVMVSFWSVHDKEGAELLRKKTVLEGVAKQPGVNGQVAVQNSIVTEFSMKIATALASLSSR